MGSASSIDAHASHAKDLKNSAFLFIKPHANNDAVIAYVKAKLEEKGITIVQEGKFTGPEIDEQKLIDNHYYSIASKATLTSASDIVVPKDIFSSNFNEDWDTVVAEERSYNALDFAKKFSLDNAGLAEIWATAKIVKFGGGFYCGQVEKDGAKYYIFNGFFISLRDKFTNPDATLTYFSIEWSPETLSWKDFRGNFLGTTDPTTANPESLRGHFYANYESFNLTSQPNVSDNCVHASASPLEGMVERHNWLKTPYSEDSFGKLLLSNNILSEEEITVWSSNPTLANKPVFDAVEDLNVFDCIKTIYTIKNPEASTCPAAEAPAATETPAATEAPAATPTEAPVDTPTEAPAATEA